MEPDINEVLATLAKHVGDLTVRLALAESRAAAFERAAVEQMAEQESDDGAS